MSLNLAKTVVDFVAEHAEQKFTARDIAQWIFENYPAECHEEKTASTVIHTDADLVQQIVAEIGSQRPVLQKRNPQLRTTEGQPRHYYWTNKSDDVEVAVLERHPDEAQHGPLGRLDITAQQLLGGCLVDTVGEPVTLIVAHHVTVADGRPAAGQK